MSGEDDWRRLVKVEEWFRLV